MIQIDGLSSEIQQKRHRTHVGTQALSTLSYLRPERKGSREGPVPGQITKEWEQPGPHPGFLLSRLCLPRDEHKGISVGLPTHGDCSPALQSLASAGWYERDVKIVLN